MYPEIHWTDQLSTPSYLVILSIGYSAFVFLFPWWAHRQGLNGRIAMNITLIVMIFGAIGGRLSHVFFENPHFYMGHWERVLYFWLGGFVFFGGFLLSLLASVVYLRLQNQIVGQWLDLFAPVASLGYAYGRISCFFAGCCYGDTCDLPWAIDGKHPTQLYAVFWELAVFTTLVLINKGKLKIPGWQRIPGDGVLFAIWLILHSLGRLVMEHYRADYRGPTYMGLSISSILCFILIFFALIHLLRNMRSKLAKN